VTGEHDSGCPVSGAHTDAARHASDAVNLHWSALQWGAVKRWVAVRLSDGKSDGTLYDTKRDAIRHQLHEQQCAYVCIPPGGMNACQAESMLSFSRRAYDAGMRLPDPDARDGGGSLIPRLTRRDQTRQIARLATIAR
jgi:hypothetical protein